MLGQMNFSFTVVVGLGLLHYGTTVAIGHNRQPFRHGHAVDSLASASNSSPVFSFAPPNQEPISNSGFIQSAYSQSYTGDKQTLMARPVTYVPPQITFNPPQLVYGPPSVTSALASPQNPSYYTITPQSESSSPLMQSNPSYYAAAESSPASAQTQPDPMSSYSKNSNQQQQPTNSKYQVSIPYSQDGGSNPPGLDEVVSVLAKYFNATRAQVTKSLTGGKDDSASSAAGSGYPSYSAPTEAIISPQSQYQSPPQPVTQEQYQTSSPQTTYQTTPPQPSYQAPPPQPMYIAMTPTSYQVDPKPSPAYQSAPPSYQIDPKPSPAYQSAPPTYQIDPKPSPAYQSAPKQKYSSPQPQPPKKQKKMVPMLMMMPMYDDQNDNDLDLDCEKRLSKN